MDTQQLLVGLLSISECCCRTELQKLAIPTSTLRCSPSADPAEQPSCLDQLMAQGSGEKQTLEPSSVAAAAASVSIALVFASCSTVQ